MPPVPLHMFHDQDCRLLATGQMEDRYRSVLDLDILQRIVKHPCGET